MASDADLRKEIKTHVTIEAHVPKSVIKTAVMVAALADRGRYVSKFVPRMNRPTSGSGRPQTQGLFRCAAMPWIHPIVEGDLMDQMDQNVSPCSCPIMSSSCPHVVVSALKPNPWELYMYTEL